MIMRLVGTEDGGKNEVFLKDQLFYTLDTELFNQYFGNLKSAVDEVKIESTTYLSMNVTAVADQVLYTSIPFERGWTATIDGVKTEVYRTGNGLVGINLPEGTHHITLKFLPDYFIYACIISASALILFIVIITVSRVCKKRGFKLPTAKGLMRLADGDDDSDIILAGDVNEVEVGSGDTVDKIGKLLGEGEIVSDSENLVGSDNPEKLNNKGPDDKT
jgi:hypothetical protein